MPKRPVSQFSNDGIKAFTKNSNDERLTSHASHGPYGVSSGLANCALPRGDAIFLAAQCVFRGRRILDRQSPPESGGRRYKTQAASGSIDSCHHRKSRPVSLGLPIGDYDCIAGTWFPRRTSGGKFGRTFVEQVVPAVGCGQIAWPRCDFCHLVHNRDHVVHGTARDLGRVDAEVRGNPQLTVHHTPPMLP